MQDAEAYATNDNFYLRGRRLKKLLRILTASQVCVGGGGGRAGGALLVAWLAGWLAAWLACPDWSPD